MPAPGCVLVVTTLLLTVAATFLLGAAIMTDYWEHVTYDSESVETLAKRTNYTEIEWILDGKVAMLKFKREPRGGRHSRSTRVVVYLVPLYGGIWRLCTDLEEKHRVLLKSLDYAYPRCISYLSPDLVQNEKNDWMTRKPQDEPPATCEEYGNRKETFHSVTRWGTGVCKITKQAFVISYCEEICPLEKETLKLDGNSQYRSGMQNLAISCAIVCLILLASSAFVGLFGIGKRQISAVLVTGVMYILAAVFCIFTLSIMHFKRRSGRECGAVDQQLIPKEFQAAQQLAAGWSFTLCWGGVCVCLLASVLWYLLSKIMRYGPLTIV